MGKYRLPFGAETDDVVLYVEAWKTLAGPLEKALGWTADRFDPGFGFRDEQNRIVSLSTQNVRALVTAIQEAEERGARWALERHGHPFMEKTREEYAREICEDARK